MMAVAHHRLRAAYITYVLDVCRTTQSKVWACGSCCGRVAAAPHVRALGRRRLALALGRPRADRYVCFFSKFRFPFLVTLVRFC
jgi:hypothetical protein